MAIDPCPDPAPQPQRGIVRFDATEFKVAFPAFATVDNGLLQADFDIATNFLSNSCCSPVIDAPTRQRLLYLVTAHVAALLQGENGKSPAGIVGRVDSATEGSVSVSASYATQMSMTEAYFSQTVYGATFWQATLNWRSAFYVPPPNRGCVGGFPGYSAPFPFPGGRRCC